MIKIPDDESTNEIAYGVGSVIFNFGIFEHILNLTVAAAFDLNEVQERGIIRGMQPRAKLELLDAFAKKYWPTAMHNQLTALTKDAKDLNDFRNNIAHGLVVYDAEGQWHVLTFKGASRFEGAARPLKIEELGKYVSLAKELGQRFQHLANTINIKRSARKKKVVPEI
jgi:hypothetical protein